MFYVWSNLHDITTDRLNFCPETHVGKCKISSLPSQQMERQKQLVADWITILTK